MIIPVELIDLINILSPDATKRLFSLDAKVESTYFDEKGELDLSNEFDSFLRLIYGLSLATDSVGRELKFVAARALFISGYFDPLIEISVDSAHPGVLAYRAAAKIFKTNSVDGVKELENLLSEVKGKTIINDEILGLIAFIYSRNEELRNKNEWLFQKETNIPLAIEAQGWYYLFNNDYDKALSLFTKLLTYANSKNNRFYAVLAQNGLGRLYLDQKEYKNAKEMLERALITSKSLNAKFANTLVVYNLGKLYFSIGHYEDAFEYYRQSYGIRKLLGLKWASIFPQYKVAMTSLILGNNEFGLNFMNDLRLQTIELKEQIYTRKLTNILSKFHVEEKQYLKAYRLLSNMMEIPDTLNPDRKESELLLGLLLAFMGKGSESREFVQQAVENARSEEELIDCLFVLSQLEDIAKSTDAEVLYLRALRRSEKYDYPLKRSQILLYRAEKTIEHYSEKDHEITDNVLQTIVADIILSRKIAYSLNFYVAGICCELALSYILPVVGKIEESIRGLEISETLARKTNLNDFETIIINRLRNLKQLEKHLASYDLDKVPMDYENIIKYIKHARKQVYLAEHVRIRGF